MGVSFDMRVTASADVVTRRLDDELVLLNLESENYFGLDEVGTRMWEVVTSSPNVEDAFEQLLSEYDVDAERLRDDLEQLLSRLVEAGDSVEADTEIAVVESMKMHIPVSAEQSGRVGKWLVEEKSLVAEGQALIELEA